MTSIVDRKELAKFCSSRDWSKAIRVLDSLLAQSCSIEDICNRAFCYSQLELHKHVIKDCDWALQRDPDLVKAYILKGRALSALGKYDDGIRVWDQGYQIAVRESTDLKQLLELEQLIASAKENHFSGHKERVMNSPSVVTFASEAGSEICNKFTDKHEVTINEISSKPKRASKVHEPDGEAIINPRVFMTGISKSKLISLDFRLSQGIAQVNKGMYDQAVSIFDQILRENPNYPEALIGRGTAYAFQRELDAAIIDFTKAIQANPLAGEAWKRRGQARAALGKSAEAIEDLSKALEFEQNSSDILHERGIVNFKFKDYNSAVEDLSLCVKLDKNNKSAYTYLGLAWSSIGKYERAEEALMKSTKIDPSFLDGWIHLAQFYQELANAKKAFECLEKLKLVDSRFAKAYHLYGLLYHGMGEHRKAINDLSIGLSIESSNIECLYLRASCYHAIGEYGEAVKDYDAVLDVELDSMEKFMLQCMSFYQKEIALYTAFKANSEFCLFDIDGDIHPLFKEDWCKRSHPKNVCDKVYRQPPLKDSLRKGRLRKQDFSFTKQKALLLQAADAIGKKIQYNCIGFLNNRRQYRMAGLAVIQIAQKVSKAWRSLQLDWKFSGKNGAKSGKRLRKKEKLNIASKNRGGGCSTSISPEPSNSFGINDDRSASGRFRMSWQDVYNLAVKWRQISEPCDPVVWINKLSEAFGSGFGSHTPMILDQATAVRYYPYSQKALNVAKNIIEVTRQVNGASDKIIDLSEAEKLQKAKNAESCSDLYDVVGEDFWVATKCNSTAFDGKCLEGTRITIQKMPKKGYEFAIRTPCFPSRWDEYDMEMAMAWEALCNSYCGELYGSTDLNELENVKDCILRMSYYWYNFMPLSRGSSVVAYVVMLGLFLASNMDVTACIPQGTQVDWEAILSPDLETFVHSMKSWIYPSLRVKTSWKDYPDVSLALPTTASVVAALSAYND